MSSGFRENPSVEDEEKERGNTANSMSAPAVRKDKNSDSDDVSFHDDTDAMPVFLPLQYQSNVDHMKDSEEEDRIGEISREFGILEPDTSMSGTEDENSSSQNKRGKRSSFGKMIRMRSKTLLSNKRKSFSSYSLRNLRSTDFLDIEMASESESSRRHRRRRLSGILEPKKEAVAALRHKKDCKPMASRRRMTVKLKRYFTSFFPDEDSEAEGSSNQDPLQDASFASTSSRINQQSPQVLRKRNLSTRLNPDDQSQNQPNQCDDRDKDNDEEAQQPPLNNKVQEKQNFVLGSKKARSTRVHKFLGIFGITPGGAGIFDDIQNDDKDCKCCGVGFNQLVNKYLRWAFRRSFLAVFVSAAFGFFGLTLLFAILILAAGATHPECIHINGSFFNNYTDDAAFPFTSAAQNFADAYSLSWTTFSTVGYGLVFPAVSTVHINQEECVGVTVLCTLESFVGVLFASFCGAIMFGKIARIRSYAQVFFSDVIVVRYGTGVLREDQGHDDRDENISGEDTNHSRERLEDELPCPILEFRVVNRLHSSFGGEIMDASMNIVAKVHQSQAEHIIGHRTRKRRKKRKGHRPTSSHHRFNSTDFQFFSSPQHRRSSLDVLAKSIRETATSGSAAVRPSEEEFVFVKLDIESPDHPFFKRVWYARHRLDHESPLLTEAARRAVAINGGFWPVEMNDADTVQAAINFEQILVSLSGTSNVDANSVYAQKEFRIDDINVGFRFTNLLYRDDRDGKLKVETSDINELDIQAGGFGEGGPSSTTQRTAIS